MNLNCSYELKLFIIRGGKTSFKKTKQNPAVVYSFIVIVLMCAPPPPPRP